MKKRVFIILMSVTFAGVITGCGSLTQLVSDSAENVKERILGNSEEEEEAESWEEQDETEEAESQGDQEETRRREQTGRRHLDALRSVQTLCRRLYSDPDLHQDRIRRNR